MANFDNTGSDGKGAKITLQLCHQPLSTLLKKKDTIKNI